MDSDISHLNENMTTQRNVLEESKDDSKLLNLIKNITEKCKQERDNQCVKLPLDDYLGRVCYYTGYPKKIILEKLDEIHLNTDEILDDEEHILIMEIINDILLPNRSVHNLYEKFVEKLKKNGIRKSIMSANKFENVLFQLGYEYKKSIQGIIVCLENPKIKYERFKYLQKILNYRKTGKRIYYIDEKKFIKSSNFVINNDFLSLYYMISENGYEHGLFTYHEVKEEGMQTHDTFKKWISNIVLNIIKPSSVVVMSNKLHRKYQKSISRYHSKKVMMDWLNDHNIPFDAQISKVTLYELIDKCTVAGNTDSDIDRLIKAHGHDVLRVPSTFPALNLIDQVWKFFDKNVKLPSNCPQDVVKETVQKFFINISNQDWEQLVQKVTSLELTIIELDRINETLMEQPMYILDEDAFLEQDSNITLLNNTILLK